MAKDQMERDSERFLKKFTASLTFFYKVQTKKQLLLLGDVPSTPRCG